MSRRVTERGRACWDCGHDQADHDREYKAALIEGAQVVPRGG